MRLLLTLLVYFICSTLFAQKSPTTKGNTNCVYHNKYSLNKRPGFYPFNSYKKIEIVAFRYNMDNLAVKDPIILRDSILESTILTVTQIDQLTDILYNHFYKKRPNYGISSCFYPRNAILFFDANGNLKESILICFQCDQYALSSTSINIGDDCDQKLTLLKAFFSKSGIYFGTSDNPLFYPGEKYKDEGITISEK